MNRRSFMQRCFGVLGGVVAVFVPSKASPEELTDFPANPDMKAWALKPPERCTFHGRKIKGYGNRIFWEANTAKFGKWDGIDMYESAILPTSDRLRYFHKHEGRLFWVGEHETWEIQYTGDKHCPFQWTECFYPCENEVPELYGIRRTNEKD